MAVNKFLRIRTLATLGVTGLLALGVIGCGGSSSSSSEQPSTNATNNTTNASQEVQTATITGTLPNDFELASDADLRALTVADVGVVCSDGNYIDGYYTNNGKNFVVPNVPVGKACVIVFTNKKNTGGSEEPSDAQVVAVTPPIKPVNKQVVVNIESVSNGVCEVKAQGAEVKEDVDVSTLVGKPLNEVTQEISQVVSEESTTTTQETTSTQTSSEEETQAAEAVGNVVTGWTSEKYIGFGIERISELKDVNGNLVNATDIVGGTRKAKLFKANDKTYMIIANNTKINLLDITDKILYDDVKVYDAETNAAITNITATILGDKLFYLFKDDQTLYAVPYTSLEIKDKRATFKAYKNTYLTKDKIGNETNLGVDTDELYTLKDKGNGFYRIFFDFENNELKFVKIKAASLAYDYEPNQNLKDYKQIIALGNEANPIYIGDVNVNSIEDDSYKVTNSDKNALALIKWDEKNKKFVKKSLVLLEDGGLNTTLYNATKIIPLYNLNNEIRLVGINLDDGNSSHYNSTLAAVDFTREKVKVGDYLGSGNVTNGFKLNATATNIFVPADLSSGKGWLWLTLWDGTNNAYKLSYIKAYYDESEGQIKLKHVGNTGVDDFTPDKKKIAVLNDAYVAIAKDDQVNIYGASTISNSVSNIMNITSMSQVNHIKAAPDKDNVLFVADGQTLKMEILKYDEKSHKEIASSSINGNIDLIYKIISLGDNKNYRVIVKDNNNFYHSFITDVDSEKIGKQKFENKEIKPVKTKVTLPEKFVNFDNQNVTLLTLDYIPYYNKLELALSKLAVNKGYGVYNDNGYAKLVKFNLEDKTDAQAVSKVKVTDANNKVNDIFGAGDYIYVLDNANQLGVYKNNNGKLEKEGITNLGFNPMDIVGDATGENLFVLSPNGYIYQYDKTLNKITSAEISVSKELDTSLDTVQDVIPCNVNNNGAKAGYAGNYLYVVAAFNDIAINTQNGNSNADFVYLLIYPIKDGKVAQKPIKAVKLDYFVNTATSPSVQFAKVVGKGNAAKLYIYYTFLGKPKAKVFSLKDPLNPTLEVSQEMDNRYIYTFSSQGIVGINGDKIIEYTYPSLGLSPVNNVDAYTLGALNTPTYGYGKYFFGVDNLTNKRVVILNLEDPTNKIIKLAGDVNIDDISAEKTITAIYVAPVGDKTYLYVGEGSYVIVYDLNPYTKQNNQ